MATRLRPVLLICSVVAVIGVASAILASSLETDRKAQELRQFRFLRNAGLAVLDDLGAELFAMYSAFSLDLYAKQEAGQPLSQATLVAAVHRYQAQARFPQLFQDLSCVVSRGGELYRFASWGPLGWVDGERPDWAVDLRAPLAAVGEVGVPPRPSPVFSLEKPVLTMYFKAKHPVDGEVVAVALRFSTQVVLEEVIPSFVKQRLTETPDGSSYRATVRNLRLSRDHEPTPDWQAPLLPWTRFDGWFDYYVNRRQNQDFAHGPPDQTADWRQNSAEGTSWALSVSREPSGLAAEMTRLAWRNALLVAGFFLFLSLTFLGLYGMARQARRMAQQERTFLALISHELKTPLAVVRSLADNLAQGIGTEPSRVREYGEILQEESNRLSRMIGNVLGLTALQGGISVRDRVPVAIEDLVRERLSRQEPYPDTEVTVQIHPALCPVQGQPAALAAAVDNLIGNAFRHGTSGPPPHHIRISVEPCTRWGVRGVALTIVDNGPGFTRREAWSFRRPFRRGDGTQDRQTPGSGVGLSLVRTTAEALGGDLRWSGKPGRGACFTLWLREAIP